MRLGVPGETRPRERRVAATPETVKKLAGLGFTVVVEAGAGSASRISDDDYVAAGAEIGDPWQCTVMIKVEAPTAEEAAKLPQGAVLLSHAWPDDQPDVVQALAGRGVTWLAAERVPRIARAQSMDVLSSMSNLAGYRAILEGAYHFGRYFPMLMTAAGTVPPAQVMVIGAGVAGLSAIATARRLGAVVRAFDTRPAVKEQVQSLGARFLEMELEESAETEGGYAKMASAEFLRKEMELFSKHTADVDIVVTTALVAGGKAPTLIPAYMVEGMKPGSVIVDLAAPRGGNCELTVPNEVVERHGVTIVGHTDLASRMAPDASRLFARNYEKLMRHMKSEEGLNLAADDEIVGPMLVLEEGQRL